MDGVGASGWVERDGGVGTMIGVMALYLYNVCVLYRGVKILHVCAIKI